MYIIGDKIIYGQTGVCVVEDICEKTLSRNNTKMYYTLRPIYQHNNMIYTPVDNDKVFMRPVISKSEAENLIKTMPEIQKKAMSDDNEQNIGDKNKADFSSHNCSDLAEMAIRIYAKKQAAHKLKKKLGFMDEKNIKRAEDLLFGELAVALEMPLEDVPKVIFSSIRSN